MLSSVKKACLTLDFLIPYPMQYGLIPAVSYNGNPWGPGREIKGFSSEGQPWTFVYHRVAVCGGTYSESKNWSVALFAKEGFKGSCSLMRGDNRIVHRLVVPEVETPRVYILRDEYTEAYEAELDLDTGDSYKVTAYLLLQPNEKPRQGWRTLLDIAWRQHNYIHNPLYSAEELWRWSIEYATQGLWSKEEFFKGFCIGMQ